MVRFGHISHGRDQEYSPYLAARAGLTRGPDGYVLTIEFGAPAPLGMLR